MRRENGYVMQTSGRQVRGDLTRGLSKDGVRLVPQGAAQVETDLDIQTTPNGEQGRRRITDHVSHLDQGS